MQDLVLSLFCNDRTNTCLWVPIFQLDQICPHWKMGTHKHVLVFQHTDRAQTDRGPPNREAFCALDGVGRRGRSTHISPAIISFRCPLPAPYTQSQFPLFPFGPCDLDLNAAGDTCTRPRNGCFPPRTTATRHRKRSRIFRARPRDSTRHTGPSRHRPGPSRDRYAGKDPRNKVASPYAWPFPRPVFSPRFSRLLPMVSHDVVFQWQPVSPSRCVHSPFGSVVRASPGIALMLLCHGVLPCWSCVE